MANIAGARSWARYGNFLSVARHVLLIFLLVPVGPAFAIPSPELIVGTVSSLSQLFTVLTAMLGGGALIAGARASRSGPGAGRMSRIAGWLGAGAFLALGLSLGGNWYQYSQAAAERQTQLETTLLRPSRQPGMPQLDPTMKELSYSQQQTHPQGMSTDDAAKLIERLGKGDAGNEIIIDVRETAESQMGNLPGAIIARYPDFDDAKLDLNGKKVVLFCHNGNRSHETCEMLKARGIDCRFIVGGLEKWVTEGREMTGMSTRTIESLRAIPPYPTQRTLLDTAKVHELVRKQKAVFVDVRYEPEFKAGHLPDAIDLPIRRITKAQLATSIAALPKKPIIMPCYDRRGCFFAEVLGWELTQAGYDVRGRYTLPWEYFPPANRPPHVEKWIADSQVGPWKKLDRWATSQFGALAALIGLLGAIAAAAVASRVAVLPFSLKAERDQLVTAAAGPQLADLKRRLAGDPLRLSRAITALYKSHGLSPLWNMLALTFLPVMALVSVAVQRVAIAKPTALFWMDNLGQRDPYWIWPILAAGLLGVYLHLALVNKPRHGFVLWLLAVPFLAASLGLLSAAVIIYVAVSALLLLAQRAIVTGWLAARIGQVRAMLPGGSAWLANSGIVDLTDVARLQACGNKASRLGVLKRAGISVPSGVVLTAKFLNDYNAASEAGRARRLKRVWARVGSDKVAVRSAASSEDGASRSFAGVFESVLNVSQLNFAKAIDRVAQSFVSDRAKSYGPAAGASNIIVQRMVPAQYSGVMFTRDPAAAGMILVELVEGLADEMVSGAKTPTAFRFGRLSGRPFDAVGTKPPVELEELLAIGQQTETRFGAPQDIEWAYSDGRFQIVQCRDIVPLAIEGDAQIIHAEWSRVLSLVAKRPVAEVALVQSELAELLPRPTPLSLSLMEDLWSSGGSVDLACSRLGLRYAVDEASPDYVVTVLGQLYVDQHEVTKRAPHIGSLSLRRLLRTSKQFEADFRDRFLPEFLADIRLAEAIDFDRLATPDLVAALTRRWTHFVENTHVEVDIVNILAQLYLDEAKRKLTSAKRDAGTYLAARGTSEPKRVLAAAMAASGAERSTLLVSGMGHRAVLDYELAQPRYAEQLSALAQLGSESAVAVGPAKTPPTLDPGLAATVARACDFQVLKEDAKHHSLRELAVLRRIVLAVDRRFELDGSVFHLTLAELQELPTAGRDSARGLAAERRRHRQSFADITLPSSALTPAAIEAASAGVALSAERHARLGGTRVAGSQVAIGRARVMSPIAAQAGQPIADFQPSDIIVSRMIHSDWLPHLKHAGGLVSEIGGWLSHMALVAREYDLPMIVGCQGISAISDGDVVELQLDGRISILENRLPMVAE